MKKVYKEYEFSECTAIALESGDNTRQNAIFCHKIGDDFCDGDFVAFGYSLPEDEDDAETIICDYSAQSSDYETLGTVSWL